MVTNKGVAESGGLLKQVKIFTISRSSGTRSRVNNAASVTGDEESRSVGEAGFTAEGFPGESGSRGFLHLPRCNSGE